MAGVLWVILVLSVVTVADRIYYTYLALNRAADAVARRRWAAASRARSSGPTSARRSPTTSWVIAILAFVWLTPPGVDRRPDGHRSRPRRLDHARRIAPIVVGRDSRRGANFGPAGARRT